MQKFYNKPKNWQDFELLCKNLWKEELKCRDISRHGRQGQKQYGVDIYGNIENSSELFGIQCKGKDEYNHSQITIHEINQEIEKALTFHPRLSLFIFATTSNRDEEIQEYIRIKDKEFFASHGMHIGIKFWDCIEELLDLYSNVKNWYNDTLCRSFNIEVEAILPEGQLTPRFNRVTRKYITPSKELYKLGINPFFLTHEPITDIFHQRPYKNHTFCEFEILLTNTGNTTIDDFSLELTFNDTEVQAISNMNDKFTNNPLDFELNRIKTQNMELFHTQDDYCLIFEPKSNVLVQKDSKGCRIGLFPAHSTTEIHIMWRLLARDFDIDGEIVIPVSPYYIDVQETKYVQFSNEVRVENVIEDGIEYIDNTELTQI